MGEITMAKRSVKRIVRHAFRFKIEGQDEPFVVWTKAINARSRVELMLTAADVRRALELRGMNNTQKCAGAICAKRQKHLFSHPVEGYVDWQYRRAYVVSRTKNGMPSVCVVYGHHDDTAQMFDKEETMRKLLRDLEMNGPRKITLLPPPRHKSQKGVDRPMGKRDGTRVSRPHGAKL